MCAAGMLQFFSTSPWHDSNKHESSERYFCQMSGTGSPSLPASGGAEICVAAGSHDTITMATKPLSSSISHSHRASCLLFIRTWPASPSHIAITIIIILFIRLASAANALISIATALGYQAFSCTPPPPPNLRTRHGLNCLKPCPITHLVTGKTWTLCTNRVLGPGKSVLGPLLKTVEQVIFNTFSFDYNGLDYKVSERLVIKKKWINEVVKNMSEGITKA